ncbi:MAG: ImmA/IrrE family metallo-endopeptidase [Chitinophagales bacterium]
MIGRYHYTRQWIENKAEGALLKWCPEVLQKPKPFSIEKISELIVERGYRVELNADLEFAENGKKILGCLSLETPPCIYIDRSLQDERRRRFVFAHELGHFVLHRKIIFEIGEYDRFIEIDEEMEAEQDDRYWLEWQANKFAAALLMPQKTFSQALIAIQKEIGLSKTGFIYLSKERYSQQDYRQTVDALAIVYGVSKSQIQYRLRSLDLIHDDNNPKSLAKLIPGNIWH